MKNITHLLIVAIVLIVSATALFAKDDSIVSELERQDNGGVVKVYQSPELTTLLLRDTTAVEERMVQG